MTKQAWTTHKCRLLLSSLRVLNIERDETKQNKTKQKTNRCYLYLKRVTNSMLNTLYSLSPA